MAVNQAGWVVLGTLVLASPMLSQQPQLERIPYAATCATCRIQFTKLLTVGSPADPVLLTTSPIFFPGKCRGRATGADRNGFPGPPVVQRPWPLD
jgi:hypothetical protein